MRQTIAANWCLIVRIWGDTPASLIACRYMAQGCRNIQPSFSKCSGIHKVCLGFKRIHKNVDRKYFNKSENSEKNKIMIWGIHFLTT